MCVCVVYIRVGLGLDKMTVDEESLANALDVDFDVTVCRFYLLHGQRFYQFS